MKNIFLLVLFAVLVACGHVSPDEARKIAYQRLSTFSDGPSLHGDALLSALVVTEQNDGKYLVEVRDELRNLLWAVIIQRSGKSEITRMAIDG
jgi:hypothetical protein